ncbi:MAG: drug/metabolite transporter (DMT)-like permease [Candidatus Endobugula sp.]|jgi:drug/metabolite transporter (DMT)-like permease
MKQLFFSLPLAARYMVMSALGFALMGVFVKVAYAQGIPVLEIVAARALVSALLSYADVRRKGIPLLGQRKGLLFARGMAGAIALLCVYTALVNMPFADATVLQYLHPMFTAVLAIIFLRERLQLPTVLCIVFSFIGLLIMVRPEFLFSGLSGEYSLWAIAAAVMGAFGSAVAYVLVRKLNATEDVSVIIFYFPMIALPLSLAMLGNDIVMPQGWTWLVLLMVGISTQLGQIGLTKAMQTEGAAKATSFSYLQVVFAIVLGFVYFNEIPSVWTLLGALLILTGALINVVVKKRET